MCNYDNRTDEELVLLQRQGEGQVMDFLLEKYKPLVRKKCNALYLIGGETEDLIQEGMIGLFKAVRDYDHSQEASFFTFASLCISRQLYTALEASNRLKHQPLNAYVSLSGDEDENSSITDQIQSPRPTNPEAMVLEQEKIQEFYQSLAKKLSTMEQRVLTLYLEGYNYIQIGKIMDKPPKSIDNALQRIRTKVKTLLEERKGQ